MTTHDLLVALACSEGRCACVRSVRAGNGLTHCPAHQDRTPSLNVTKAGDTMLVHCLAGCSQDAVIEALRERSLWNGSTTIEPKRAKIVATYDYTSESGALIHQTVRYRPKRFAQRRPDGLGGWVWNLDGVERVLYNLPNVVAVVAQSRRAPSDATWTIYIAEGEKDCDTLNAMGLVATTNVGGAGKWHDRYSDILRDARVTVIADKDSPGRKHAEAVAASLAGRAALVKVIELPGDEVKDVSDWVSAGGVRADLDLLSETAPVWTTRDVSPTGDNSMVAVTTVIRALTDLGNAERLVARHCDHLRYCAALDGWYVWNGRRWARDDTGEVTRYATESVLSLYDDAQRVAPDARADLVRHAVRSEADQRISAMLHLARADARVALRVDAFDADPFRLNVANGTLDLRTGDLHPHDRADLITRMSPVRYDPDARLDRWDDFLFTATGADPDLLAYLQRAAGYSLTGDTGEEVLFFVHGPEASGKSTFVAAMNGIGGDYAATADFDTFLARHDAGPRNDLARLAGKRLVVSIEMDEGRRLAEGLVKMITGGDTVTARFLYREAFEFVPAAKLWLVANSKPRVSNADGAMWRRIRLIPFEHTVPVEERDPELKAVLRDAEVGGPAVLAWAIRGCLAWQREGLGDPERVRVATARYRDEMIDALGDFLEERCLIAPDASIAASDLHAAYGAWAERTGEKPMSKNLLGRSLGQRGYESVRSTDGGTRRWRGIGLKGTARENV